MFTRSRACLESTADVSEELGEMTQIHTLSGEEGNGSTSLTSTTCATDTVNVILRVVGVIIVENVSDIANIFGSKG